MASWSKDPSTKVGAVVVRPDKTIASLGYNGFPRGVKDSTARLNNREVKYSMVVHAEANALLSAREPLHGYTLYSSLCPCADCAKLIIQAGITSVFFPVGSYLDTNNDRWQDSWDRAMTMMEEAGVTVMGTLTND